MASQTAGDILRVLGENKKSLTEITEHLALPLTTVKYHLENLLDAGLVRIAETKYSSKGREVVIYSLSDQLFVVAPPRSDVRSFILKYASLLGIVAVGTFVLSLILPMMAGAPLSTGRNNFLTSIPAAAPDAPHEANLMATQMAYKGFGGALSTTDPVITCFIGGVFVILILLLYEISLWKRH